MQAGFFLKGLAIGFSIAAPVGPIGILCIRRSLAEGPAIGLAVGMGAACADAVYGCVAGFGLTAISSFLVNQQFWLGLIGGAFLCFLGVRTFLSPPAAQPASAAGSRWPTALLSTFLLTLTNPATILSFIAVFAGFGIGASGDYRAASLLVVGVFLGSATWWLILSSAVSRLRSRVITRWMQNINRLSGAILIGFGVVSAWQAFQ